MKVTIYDVAKEAKTSPSTVSRVLNSSSLISDERSKVILKIAEKLGYKKRPIKKQRGRAVLSVKLVLGRLDNKKLPLIYSVTDLIQGIKEGLPDNLVNIICETSNDSNDLFSNKKAGHIDAIIFAFTTIPRKTKQHMDEANIPYLVLNRAPFGYDFIAFNNEEGMREVTLAACAGKKAPKPCFLEMNPKHEVTAERRKGFHKACDELGIKKPLVEAIESTDEINTTFVKDIAKKGINCLIGMNDIIASRFMITALDAGFNIPKDFALTGFDGSPLLSILPKKLDTISLEVQDLGKKAGEWINMRVIARNEQKFQIRISGKHIKGDTI